MECTNKKKDRRILVMARGKVQMRRIENPVHRQISFCKRQFGLLKKAKELSILCDAQIGVMVFSPRGKTYELATNGNMRDLIERYKGSNMEALGESSKQNKPQLTHEDVLVSAQEIDLLQKGLRYMYGAKDIDHMNLYELEALESNIQIWAHNVRYIQIQIKSREIEMLNNKVGILKATNDMLQERIIEQSRILDAGTNTMIPQFHPQRTMESGLYF